MAPVASSNSSTIASKPVAPAIGPGLADPAIDGQRVFRAALDAMARPCLPVAFPVGVSPPAPLCATAAGLVLALADFETSVWLDGPLAAEEAVARYVRFHTGARIAADPAEATFAVVSAPTAMPQLSAFAQGTPEYPDRSTTIILQAEPSPGEGWRFDGPGFEEPLAFTFAPAPSAFADQWRANRALFPRGVDLMLAGRTQIVALPRSARLLED